MSRWCKHRHNERSRSPKKLTKMFSKEKKNISPAWTVFAYISELAGASKALPCSMEDGKSSESVLVT
jgi:hypothetical protein